MSRRVARLTLDNVADLSGRCSTCVFWQLDPVRRIRARGHEARRAVRLGQRGAARVGLLRTGPVRRRPAGGPHPLRARGLRARGQPAPDRTGVARTPCCWSRPGSTRRTGAGGWVGCSCRRWPRTWSSAAASGRSRRSARCRAAGARTTTGTASSRRAASLPADYLLGVGFRTHRPHARYPRMRMDLRSVLTWRGELEAAFDRLLSPVRHRSPAVRPPTAHTPAHRTLD